jgi:hypothetical protein
MEFDAASDLRRLQELLARCDEPRWAATIGRIRIGFDPASVHCKMEFRGLMGGMGSLSDLVLHDDACKPLHAESDELYRLVERLGGWALSRSSP